MITANGYHHYYRWPDNLRIKTCRIGPQVEIRAAGAYVVAPPSIHPNGDTYQWAQRSCDWEVLPDLPPEWINLQPASENPPDNIVRIDTASNNSVALKRLTGLANHLAATTKGNRHRALYTIARTLGGLVASHHLTREQVHEALYAATVRNGLLAEDKINNITRTINDGIEKGISDGPDPEHHEPGERNPYTLPTTPNTDDDGINQRPVPGEHMMGDVVELRDSLVRLRPASQFEAKKVRYAVPGLVPIGMMTYLVGTINLGKTGIAIEWAARASRGQLGGDFDGPINVVFLSAEDSPEYVLKPRLMAAGGDVDRVYFLSVGAETFQFPEETEELRDEVERVAARFVVIDPLAAFLSGSVDTHKDSSTRRTLSTLVKLAEETDSALLCLAHTNKGYATDIVRRTGGSIAFTAQARSVLLVAQDPEATEPDTSARVLVHAKLNVGEQAPTRRYFIEKRFVDVDGQHFDTQGIAWGDEAPHLTTAKVLSEPSNRETSRLEVAIDFLRDILSDGPLLATEVGALAEDKGIAEQTMKRAKKKLHVESERDGFGPGSTVYWTLPAHRVPTQEVGTLWDSENAETLTGHAISHRGSTSRDT